MESARAADAHDAGCGAVSWRAQGQLMLMMQGAGRFRGERKSARAAHAHDAGCGAVSWRAQGQLMLMMQGAGRFRGERKGS